MRRRWWSGLLALALIVAVGPVSAAPDEDGQPTDAPSRYDATAPTGWMTSASADRVHDFAQIGNTVYVAGAFAGIRPTRNGPSTPRTNIAAFDATTGEPRAAFAPSLNGPVYSLEPSPDGSRLYLGGGFTSVNGATRNRIVALDPTSGALVPGFTPVVGGGSVRSLVLRSGILYAGGNFTTASGQTRTGLAAFDTTGSGVPLAGWAPVANGTGGVLTLEASPDGSRLYAGGRFNDVDGQPSTAYLAALDRATGAVDPAFAVRLDREVFDVLADQRGMVWVAQGGALGRVDVFRASDASLITRHETAGDAETIEEVGDLVYVGGHDIGLSQDENIGVVDPAAPAILETAPFDEPTTGGDGTWAIHSTGRDLWVGGNVSGPYYGFGRYPAVPDPPVRSELSPVLSSWRYLDTAAAPSGWRAPGFDDSAWPTGGAELGFGDGGEATLLRSGRGTYYFRRTFSVSDVDTVRDLRLDVLADDGAAVFVNGTEVARINLPTGTLTDSSRATVGLSGNAEDTFTPVTVPSSVLVEGTNTLAVEVHQNASASSDLSFDARLSAVRGTGPVPDTTPPSAPADVVASGTTHDATTLSWTASTDDVGVDHYEVFRDGTLIGSPIQPTLAVTGLTPSTTYAFRVQAVDAADNRSALSATRSVTTSAAPSAPVDLVARGATWR
ncbi:MAG TPA: fibronectin type III domain-containing protein, partial [Acidimicrobiales bacterium]|nr:fibronectin type III domain-containing protein [Acidimicrobiales bacterium]